MPELPEVETVRGDLESQVVGDTITGVETDWQKTIKEPPWPVFEREIRNRRILAVRRRAKNLLLQLSGGSILAIHLKMTGHLLMADRALQVKEGRWVVPEDHPLAEPENQFIHVVFALKSNRVLALSDLRKFANVKLLDEGRLAEMLAEYGPEPLEKGFTEEVLKAALGRRKAAVKKVIMDQGVIAGIGNIYSDEILFDARIRPGKPAQALTDAEVRRLFESTKKILRKGLDLRGTSTSDFRDTSGLKGRYGDVRLVYGREGEPCPVCGKPITRVKMGGRSSHFCSSCQA